MTRMPIPRLQSVGQTPPPRLDSTLAEIDEMPQFHKYTLFSATVRDVKTDHNHLHARARAIPP